MAKNAETKIILSGDAEGAKKAIGQTEQELEKLGKKAKEQSKNVEAFGSSLANAFKIAAASLAVAQFIDANKSLEQLERGFTAVTGSAEDGAKALQRAKEIAEQLGAPLASTAQAYLDFTAAVQGSVIQGDVADAVFGAVTSALGAMGASTERTQNALLALSQMAAKGTISMEELRGQLGEALPQGMRAMASGLGLTVAELTKLVESGKLLAEDGLPALGRALLEVGGAGGKADTFTANWERLKNAVNEAYTTIGQGAIWHGLISALTFATDGIRAFSKGIDDVRDRLRAWADDTDVATLRLWDQQAAQKQVAEATKTAASSILNSRTSYARLTLDVETASWRKQNNSSNNRVEWIDPIGNLLIQVINQTVSNNSTVNVTRYTGIGIDSETVDTNSASGTNVTVSGGDAYSCVTINKIIGIGYHYAAALEFGGASGTTTWYGGAADKVFIRAILNI